MKTLGFLAVAVLAANSAGAQARSGEDVAAWYGMMLTPVGAFPTMEPTSGFTLRASRWNDRPVANVGQTSFGVAYRPHAAAGIQYDVTAGWVHSDASRLRDGTGLIGASVTSAIWQNGSSDASTLGVDWKLSAGFGHSTAIGGIEYWSIVGQIPVRGTYRMANKSALSAFASAGYGFAGVGDYADADQGLAPLISVGGGWTSPGGFGLHVGTQQVIADLGASSTPWVTGVSIVLPMGR